MIISIVTTMSNDRIKYFKSIKKRLINLFKKSNYTLFWNVQLLAKESKREVYSEDNIKIIHTSIKCNVKNFPKARLLNFGISQAEAQYFDRLVMLDVDLLLRDGFISLLENMKKKDVLFLGGEKLKKEFTEKYFLKEKSFYDIDEDSRDALSVGENLIKRYIGNIALTNESYKILKNYVNPLYNPRFIGFGGEDNVLSFLVRDLTKKNILSSRYVYSAWYHLWHERAIEKDDFDKKQYEKNFFLFKKIVEENRKKIKENY